MTRKETLRIIELIRELTGRVGALEKQILEGDLRHRVSVVAGRVDALEKQILEGDLRRRVSVVEGRVDFCTLTLSGLRPTPREEARVEGVPWKEDKEERFRRVGWGAADADKVLG